MLKLENFDILPFPIQIITDDFEDIIVFLWNYYILFKKCTALREVSRELSVISLPSYVSIHQSPSIALPNIREQLDKIGNTGHAIKVLPGISHLAIKLI